MYLGLCYDFFTEVATKVLWSAQINWSSDDRGEFYLEAGKTYQADSMPRFKLYEHIYIAVGTEILPQHRAKERQFRDVIAPTKLCNLIAVEDKFHIAHSKHNLLV